MQSNGKNRDTKQLPLRLPADLYDQLKGRAFVTQESMNQHVVQAITLYLAQDGHAAAVDAIVTKAQKDYRTVLDKLK